LLNVDGSDPCGQPHDKLVNAGDSTASGGSPSKEWSCGGFTPSWPVCHPRTFMEQRDEDLQGNPPLDHVPDACHRRWRDVDRMLVRPRRDDVRQQRRDHSGACGGALQPLCRSGQPLQPVRGRGSSSGQPLQPVQSLRRRQSVCGRSSLQSLCRGCQSLQSVRGGGPYGGRTLQPVQPLCRRQSLQSLRCSDRARGWPVQPVQSLRCGQSVQPVRRCQPLQPVQPLRRGVDQPLQSMRCQPVQSVCCGQSVQSLRCGEPLQPVQSLRCIELAKGSGGLRSPVSTGRRRAVARAHLPTRQTCPQARPAPRHRCGRSA